MHLNHLALGASLGLSTLATAFVPAPTIDTDILALKALSNLVASQAKKVLSGSTSNCTFSNVAVRREWLVWKTSHISPLKLTISKGIFIET
jgi:hypothetical protein